MEGLLNGRESSGTRHWSFEALGVAPGTAEHSVGQCAGALQVIPGGDRTIERSRGLSFAGSRASMLPGLCRLYCHWSFGLEPLRSGWLFLSGWLPVFLFALSGTSLELLGRPTCPRSESDVPLCFFSLAIASGLLAAFILARRIPSVGKH